jgi:hypothetical protein
MFLDNMQNTLEKTKKHLSLPRIIGAGQRRSFTQNPLFLQALAQQQLRVQMVQDELCAFLRWKFFQDHPSQLMGHDGAGNLQCHAFTSQAQHLGKLDNPRKWFKTT